jgi:hypothetical protein
MLWFFVINNFLKFFIEMKCFRLMMRWMEATAQLLLKDRVTAHQLLLLVARKLRAALKSTAKQLAAAVQTVEVVTRTA